MGNAVRQGCWPVITLALLLPALAQGHGIPAKEEQFAGGIPVTDTTEDWPELRLLHDGVGWRAQTTTLPVNSIHHIRAGNDDSIEHLLVMGTAGSLADQGLMHRLMPERRSEYPNTRWVAAGASASLVWEFNRPGTVIVQCLIAGHEQEQPLHLAITPLTGP